MITNWVDPRAWLGWMYYATEPGVYTVEALVKADEPSKLIIGRGEDAAEAEIPATRGEFMNIRLGEIEISETGNVIFELHPVRDDWKGLELAKVELVK